MDQNSIVKLFIQDAYLFRNGHRKDGEMLQTALRICNLIFHIKELDCKALDSVLETTTHRISALSNPQFVDYKNIELVLGAFGLAGIHANDKRFANLPPIGKFLYQECESIHMFNVKKHIAVKSNVRSLINLIDFFGVGQHDHIVSGLGVSALDVIAKGTCQDSHALILPASRILGKSNYEKCNDSGEMFPLYIVIAPYPESLRSNDNDRFCCKNFPTYPVSCKDIGGPVWKLGDDGSPEQPEEVHEYEQVENIPYTMSFYIAGPNETDVSVLRNVKTRCQIYASRLFTTEEMHMDVAVQRIGFLPSAVDKNQMPHIMSYPLHENLTTGAVAAEQVVKFREFHACQDPHGWVWEELIYSQHDFASKWLGTENETLTLSNSSSDNSTVPPQQNDTGLGPNEAQEQAEMQQVVSLQAQGDSGVGKSVAQKSDQNLAQRIALTHRDSSYMKESEQNKDALVSNINNKVDPQAPAEEAINKHADIVLSKNMFSRAPEVMGASPLARSFNDRDDADNDASTKKTKRPKHAEHANDEGDYSIDMQSLYDDAAGLSEAQQNMMAHMPNLQGVIGTSTSLSE